MRTRTQASQCTCISKCESLAIVHDANGRPCAGLQGPKQFGVLELWTYAGRNNRQFHRGNKPLAISETCGARYAPVGMWSLARMQLQMVCLQSWKESDFHLPAEAYSSKLHWTRWHLQLMKCPQEKNGRISSGQYEGCQASRNYCFGATTANHAYLQTKKKLHLSLKGYHRA